MTIATVNGLGVALPILLIALLFAGLMIARTATDRRRRLEAEQSPTKIQPNSRRDEDDIDSLFRGAMGLPVDRSLNAQLDRINWRNQR